MRLPASEPSSARRAGFDILILARDEEPVVADTLAGLRAMLRPEDVVHVVADHCRDRTARLSAAAGARVYLRDGAGVPGKAHALRFWLDRTRKSSRPDQVVLVLDADSRLLPGSLDRVADLFAGGALVVQMPVIPSLPGDAPMPRLAAYSELVEHDVVERLRARLGWPVRLRGTGMAFRRDVLELAGARLHTSVEDLELTLRVVERGLPIAYATGAGVLDPKPVDASGVVRQRSRWFRGQLTVLRDYPGTILRIAARGPAGWLLLYDALARPKILVMPAQFLVVILVLAFSVLTRSLLTASLGVALLLPLLAEAAAYLIGVSRLGSPGDLLHAVVHVPGYMLTWARSIRLALRSDGAWLRARPISLRPPEPDRRHASESS